MFEAFPKIARLNRDMVITEKLDGTNAAVFILNTGEYLGTDGLYMLASKDDTAMFAQSRTKLISPGKQDNYGFAGWVKANAEELFKLGPGRHFGEWWGLGIQRGYGQTEKRFSLFNVGRWNEDNIPSCVSVVPTLHVGPFSTEDVADTVKNLAELGSRAAPGWKDPEGVVVYHTAANSLFKVTVKDDEKPKGLA